MSLQFCRKDTNLFLNRQFFGCFSICIVSYGEARDCVTQEPQKGGAPISAPPRSVCRLYIRNSLRLFLVVEERINFAAQNLSIYVCITAT